ncbi:MAG: DUF3606 domain-containing protein [Janthinobacterium lividum]
MTDQKTNQTTMPDGVVPDRIDVTSKASVSEWAEKLQVTGMQITDAVAEVGDLATEVEMHLKGTRSTTNSDRIDEVDKL